MELNIEDLRKICCLENIEITLHAAKRLEQRGIKMADIIACIQNGKIIEQYPTDYPYPSCLILGHFCKQSTPACCCWKQFGNSLANNYLLSRY